MPFQKDSVKELGVSLALVAGIVVVCILLSKWALDWARWKWDCYMEERVQKASANMAIERPTVPTTTTTTTMRQGTVRYVRQ